MNREPSVLDYVKSLFRGKPIAIPSADESTQVPQLIKEQPQEQPAMVDESIAPSPEPEAHSQRFTLPWRSLLALGLALAAQILLQPRPDRTWIPGFILYLLDYNNLLC